MKFVKKVLFYSVIFLFASFHLSTIKAELISQKSEKNNILKENRDKCENSFQKIFPEKSLKKDGIFIREEDMNFVEVSKKKEKKGKLIIKDERDEKNPRKLTDEDNYIVIHYGSDAVYGNGFRSGGNYGQIITKIMYQNQEVRYNSYLPILSGTYIEVYINSSITDLTNFFNPDASTSEAEINCAKIISIDLSHLKKSNLSIMSYFFCYCGSFVALDMSGINLGSVTQSSFMFTGVGSILYLNIKNTIFGEEMKQNLVSHFNDEYAHNLIVCQSEKILTVTKFEYKCCNYLINELKCGLPESTIHIDIYFVDNVEYEEGFNINTDNNHRDTVAFLSSGGNTINLGESFNINAGDKLEIYFSSEVQTLESFFDHNYDPLTEKIVSIDFSNIRNLVLFLLRIYLMDVVI